MPLAEEYLTAPEVARTLGIHPQAVSHICAAGRLAAEKIANRWLISRVVLEEFAKTYEGRPGHPRTKRKYTKRSAKWFRD